MKSNTKSRLLFASCVTSLTLFPIFANAAQVGFAGVINDNAGSEITDWKTASTTKTLDGDGDNVYGTLAHIFYTVEYKGGGTLYTFDGSDAQVGPFGGYATVDEPTGDGTTPADIQVRTTTNSGLGQMNHAMFTFTALPGSPANVRIGVATDGLDGAVFSPATIGLRQVGGISSEHTMTSTNATPDMVFFDVTGIAAGDQFQVFADSGVGGFATHQFVTWDVIPPPSPFVWDGTNNTWPSLHWDAGAGLVSGPTGVNDYATINAGTVTFAGNDTFGNHVTPASPAITINSGGTLASGGFFNTIWNLTLNGGTLLANGGVTNPFGSYRLAGAVTIGGSSPSNISSDGGSFSTVSLAVPSTTFNVNDVTASAAADLTISAVINNMDNAGLIKAGLGTLTLSALNTYTGYTVVTAGTLSLVQPYLADSSSVGIGDTATLDLQFTATDTVDKLFINGVLQATGTWGRTGHPTAQNTTPRITGDGLLQVGGYAGWASGFLPAFTNTAANLDFENDGLASGIEWVVGGNPTLNDAASVTPTFDHTSDPNSFLFTFRRRDTAAADPNTTIVVQYGSDLDGWTPAQNGVNGVLIDATTDLGGGFHQVTVAIPRALAPSGKLFVRLNVVVGP